MIPDRQWRSSSFQESKKVRVSRDLWPWPWPWEHPGCRLTCWPSCASLVAIRPFVCEKKRFAQKFTDGQTDRRRTPRHCISSFQVYYIAHSWNELKTCSLCHNTRPKVPNFSKYIWQLTIRQGRLSLSTNGDKCAMVNFGREWTK